MIWHKAAVGHYQTVTYSEQQTFKGLLHFETCRMANGRSSAKADLGHLAKVGRQCAGYLPLSRLWRAMSALVIRVVRRPTLSGPSLLRRSEVS